MAFMENIPDLLRSVFDDGLDEVLIFAFIFIFVLLSGREANGFDGKGDNVGILPLIIIAVFLLLFTSSCRTEDTGSGTIT